MSSVSSTTCCTVGNRRPSVSVGKENEYKTMRINYIDRMKGLAILLVVLGHVYSFVMGAESSEVNRFIYSFHMPLFMALSGYVAFTPPLR